MLECMSDEELSCTASSISVFARVARLKCLEEAEKYFNKGKALMYEMKERQTFLPSFEARQDTALESELEDMGAYISGLRIINKIAVEGYLHGGAQQHGEAHRDKLFFCHTRPGCGGQRKILSRCLADGPYAELLKVFQLPQCRG